MLRGENASSFYHARIRKMSSAFESFGSASLCRSGLQNTLGLSHHTILLYSIETMKFGSSPLCLLLAAASPFVALSQGNLYEELETQGFNSFQALVDADVTNTTRDLLEGMIPITLLAPTDAAVGLIADEILDWYMRPDEAGALIYRLTQVMIPGGAFDFDTVKNLDTVTALNLTMTNPMAPGPITYPVIFNSTSNELAVGVGKVIDSLKDLPATNGLIHGMDRMISIPTVVCGGSMRTFPIWQLSTDIVLSFASFFPLFLFSA